MHLVIVSFLSTCDTKVILMKKPTVLILVDDEESLGSFKEPLQKPELLVVHDSLVEATAR